MMPKGGLGKMMKQAQELQNKMAQVQRSLTGLAATKPNSKISKKDATKKGKGTDKSPPKNELEILKDMADKSGLTWSWKMLGMIPSPASDYQ